MHNAHSPQIANNQVRFARHAQRKTTKHFARKRISIKHIQTINSSNIRFELKFIFLFWYQFTIVVVNIFLFFTFCSCFVYNVELNKQICWLFSMNFYRYSVICQNNCFLSICLLFLWMFISWLIQITCRFYYDRCWLNWFIESFNCKYFFRVNF